MCSCVRVFRGKIAHEICKRLAVMFGFRENSCDGPQRISTHTRAQLHMLDCYSHRMKMPKSTLCIPIIMHEISKTEHCASICMHTRFQHSICKPFTTHTRTHSQQLQNVHWKLCGKSQPPKHFGHGASYAILRRTESLSTSTCECRSTMMHLMV